MKKISLLLLAFSCLLCFQSQAQFNKTYQTYVNGSYNRVQTIDMVDDGSDGTCVLARLHNTVFNTMENILLRRLDASGNVIFSTSCYKPKTNTGFLSPSSLVRTDNNEYIVAGMWLGVTLPSLPGVTSNPFAARFSSTGALIWLQVYHSNTAGFNYNGNFEKTSIVKARDGNPDEYIIVAPGLPSYYSGPYPAPYANDVVLNAIKIDGAGNAIWNQKYDLGAGRGGAPYSDIQDLPHTLVYGGEMEEGGEGGGSLIGKYFIAGTTIKDAYNYYNFQMAIDGNGAIVNQYRQFYVPTYPMHQNAIYDNLTNEFVMTYTMGNNSIAGNPTVSQIAVAKFDFANLNCANTDYYWQGGVVENYGVSIKQNHDLDAYVIACFQAHDTIMHDSNMYSTYFSTYNISMLKIDKFTTPVFFKRYNVFAFSFPAAIECIKGTDDIPENYVIAGTRSNFTVPAIDDMRVIRTDVNGVTCGSEEIPVEQGNMPIDLEEIPYSDFMVGPSSDIITPAIQSISEDITVCVDSDNPRYYKVISSAQDPATINVYPTLMQAGESTVHIDAYAAAKQTVDVLLLGADGRTIARQSFDLSDGLSKLNWNLPSLLPGTYVLDIRSQDKSLHQTIRLSKL